MSSTLPPQAIGTGPAPAGTSIAKPTRRVRRKKAKAPKPKSNHSAGHTYDHYKDRWASFDVDAALAEASSSESEYEYVTEEDEEATPTPATATPMTPTTGTTSTSTKSTDEPAKTLPPIRREPVTADEWRLRGNDLFRAGQYEDAVTCYERSIKVEPTAAAHGNRSMALLKLKRWAEAETDATEALGLDPYFLKAYQRRAAARTEQGNWLGAAEDTEEALRLSPGDVGLRRDRLTHVAKLLRVEGLEAPRGSYRVPTVAFAPPPGWPATEDDGKAIKDMKEKPGAVQEDTPTTTTSPEGGEGKSGKRADGKSGNRRLVIEEEDDEEEAEGTPVGKRGPSTSTGSGFSGTTTLEVMEISGGDLGTRPTQTPPTTASSPVVATSLTPVSLPPPPPLNTPPKTGSELETAWRTRTTPSDRATLVSTMDPRDLPTVLRISLTPVFLEELLLVLLTEVRVQHGSSKALALLEALPSVSRFDMVRMLLCRKGKVAVGAAWDAWLQDVEAEGDKEEVTRVRTLLKM